MICPAGNGEERFASVPVSLAEQGGDAPEHPAETGVHSRIGSLPGISEKSALTVQDVEFIHIGNKCDEIDHVVIKMMKFKPLDGRVIKERVDMTQLWDAWIAADDQRRRRFAGSMNWEKRGGKQYLYGRKSKVAKSLGPRSDETEQIHTAFMAGKKSNADRLRSLSSEMDRQAGVLRALGAGRLPLMAARTLRALRTHGNRNGVRVVGTNALYAYEVLAGVVFDSESTATGDIDLPVDDRKRLSLLTDENERIGLTRLIQSKVDKTFRPRGRRDFRLTNDRGYMIEFVRPEPSPTDRVMPGAIPLEKDDIEPAPIMGLQWLLNAPAVEVVVLDERGYPVPTRCPDPRYWALHKAWLARREDRDAFEKRRDAQQADILFRIIREKLPHLPFDASLEANIPAALGNLIPSNPSSGPEQPPW